MQFPQTSGRPKRALVMDVRDLVNVIVAMKHRAPNSPVFTAWDGPGSAGKSFLLKAIEEELHLRGLTVLRIKRDWFSFKEPERRFDKPGLQSLLTSLVSAGRTAPAHGRAFAARIRGDDNKAVEREFSINRHTVVLLDGLREIPDTVETLRFDLKIVVVAADEVRGRRHTGRGRRSGGIGWRCGFAGRIDFVVWSNVQENDDGESSGELDVLKVPRAEVTEAEDKTLISLPPPSKKLALRDFLLSRDLLASDGVYIGDEFQAGGIDRSVAEPQGLGIEVYAVDSEECHRDSRPEGVTWIGKGPDGTLEVLQDSDSLKGKKFVALDVDGTLLDRKANNQKESLEGDRGELLECLHQLLEDGTHLVFVTKNGSQKTLERVATPLLQGLDDSLVGRATFYTSNMRRKLKASGTKSAMELVPAQGVHGVYRILTMLPDALRTRLRVLLSELGSEVREDKDIGIKIEPERKDVLGHVRRLIHDFHSQ